MNTYLRNPKGGPLGKVVDYVWKKEYQKRGAVHWHMVLWMEPGTIPTDAVVAEMPQPADTNSTIGKYLRKMVRKLETHDYCTPKCFQKAFGQSSNAISASMASPMMYRKQSKSWMRRTFVTCTLDARGLGCRAQCAVCEPAWL